MLQCVRELDNAINNAVATYIQLASCKINYLSSSMMNFMY